MALLSSLLGDTFTSNIKVYAYEDRNELRLLNVNQDAQVCIEGLGYFVFYAGSDEPDDDESCFATTTGKWLLEAAHWDLVSAWQLPDNDARDTFDEDEPSRITDSYNSMFNANFTNSFNTAFDASFNTAFDASFTNKILSGSATCSITTVAAGTFVTFTGTVTGAVVGDRVIVNPPTQLGATTVDTVNLSYYAWVSSANTVTIIIINSHINSCTTNTLIRTSWPITVIKS